MAMKVREVVRRLESEGYRLIRVRGSHRQYRAPDGSHVVTVPGRTGDTLAVGTLASIRRATGLKDLR
jgi:predicted RNA binding protein YcfA (HicA-like mRNA interferase family)